MARFAPGLNDGVLFLSLVYSCIDLSLAWGRFGQCIKPVHHWLLISFIAILAFRFTHIIGVCLAAEPAGGGLLPAFRRKGPVPRAAAALTWGVGMPLFAWWTALGTSWLWQVSQQTPHCVPFPTHLWFSGLWLALCYIWLGIHGALGVAALAFEWRVWRTQAALRGLAGEDAESRWGPLADLAAGQAAAARDAGPGAAPGLTPEQIQALPCGRAAGDAGADAARTGACGVGGPAAAECPVCLMDIEPGDKTRALPACGHTFHCACIDLWLLRRGECPMCKRAVQAAGAGEWL